MTLRFQFLLLSLCLLSLPFAGCQFLKEHERALRQAQQEELLARAQTVAAALSGSVGQLYPDPDRARAPREEQGLWVAAAHAAIRSDGYADDWPDLPGRRFTAGAVGMRVRALADTSDLHVLVDIEDPTPRFHDPSLGEQPNGDRLVLTTWLEGRRQEYIVSTAAPGRVQGRISGRRLPGADATAVTGNWLGLADGHRVELRMPRSVATARLGIAYVGVSDGGVSVAGNSDPLSASAPPWLVLAPSGLEALLARFSAGDWQVRILDRWGWPLATTSPETSGQAREATWLHALFRRLLPAPPTTAAPDLAADGRLRGAPIDSALRGLASSGVLAAPEGDRLYAAATIAGADGALGVVLTESPSARYLALTNDAFVALVRGTLLTLVTVGVVLSLYAGWMRRRIRSLRSRLDQFSERLADPVTLPRSRLGDEIDDLSRTMGERLQQIGSYQRYLARLPATLNHELRTPIAIVGTSLEQLADPTLTSADRSALAHRAGLGLARMRRMLAALNEASELREALSTTAKEEIDLVGLLGELAGGFSTAYAPRSFRVDTSLQRADALVNADALAEAIEKLADNAVSFAPPEAAISLRLVRRGAWWRITVSNPGPRLPESDTGQLFDALVSNREDADRATTHLGLGLYIVRLVAEAHGGAPFAQNLADGSGVDIGFTVLV